MNHPVLVRALRAALLVCFTFASFGHAAESPSATGTIQGRVLSPATQEYLRNVEVTIAGTNLATFTGEDGFYALANVPAGRARALLMNAQPSLPC